MMEQLETGNIGIGNTSTLATLNTDRIALTVGRGVPPSRPAPHGRGGVPSPPAARKFPSPIQPENGILCAEQTKEPLYRNLKPTT